MVVEALLSTCDFLLAKASDDMLRLLSTTSLRRHFTASLQVMSSLNVHVCKYLMLGRSRLIRRLILNACTRPCRALQSREQTLVLCRAALVRLPPCFQACAQDLPSGRIPGLFAVQTARCQDGCGLLALLSVRGQNVMCHKLEPRAARAVHRPDMHFSESQPKFRACGEWKCVRLSGPHMPAPCSRAKPKPVDHPQPGRSSPDSTFSVGLTAKKFDAWTAESLLLPR